MRADGWSLDDKRQPLLADELLGVNPARALSEAEHAKNNLPDVLARWRRKDGAERQRARTDQSFCVPKAEIAGNGYDLSINRYKEVVHDAGGASAAEGDSGEAGGVGGGDSGGDEGA
jgi:type I restriction enzyme M protein